MLAGNTLLWRGKSEYWSLFCVVRDRRELSRMLGMLCSRVTKLSLGPHPAHCLLSFRQLYWKNSHARSSTKFANLAVLQSG